MESSKKPTYTKAIHAYRLKLMLKRDDLEKCCPPAKGFSSHSDCQELWSDKIYPCVVCLDFVGANPNYSRHCPCMDFGCEEARKRSEKAIKQYYKLRKLLNITRKEKE